MIEFINSYRKLNTIRNGIWQYHFGAHSADAPSKSLLRLDYGYSMAESWAETRPAARKQCDGASAGTAKLSKALFFESQDILMRKRYLKSALDIQMDIL